MRIGNFWLQLLFPTKCGQSGKPNFYKLFTNMLRFALSALDLNIPRGLLLVWKKFMHNRDTLKIKAIKSKDLHDWANFKRVCNKVNTEIKAAKEWFYNNKFTETNGDPRKMWQIIHDLTSRKAINLLIREINLNATSISESSDLSNAFNDHFSSVGPKLANDIPLSNNNDHNRFEFRPTESGQVFR